MPIAKNVINHVAFVLDASGSMQGREKDLIAVVEGQIAWLADRSKAMGHETRVSVYLFNTKTWCVIFDMDVLRLPSLAGEYRPDGGTALIDATGTAIDELGQTCTLHGDHAFVLFAFTDGDENSSRRVTASELSNKIADLDGRWTVAALVPNVHGKMDAERFGFPKGNIAIWDVDAKTGIAEMGETVTRGLDTYLTTRTAGVASKTGTLFATPVTKAAVDKAGLKVVDPDKFFIFPAVATGSMAIHIPKKTVLKSRPQGIKHVEIKEMVESTGRPYVLGNAYYELIRSEKITGNKQVVVVEVATNKVYAGKEARALIGLDEYSKRIRPMPKDALSGKPEFDIFVQSESTNRLLPVGSRVVLFK